MIMIIVIISVCLIHHLPSTLFSFIFLFNFLDYRSSIRYVRTILFLYFSPKSINTLTIVLCTTSSTEWACNILNLFLGWSIWRRIDSCITLSSCENNNLFIVSVIYELYGNWVHELGWFQSGRMIWPLLRFRSRPSRLVFGFVRIFQVILRTIRSLYFGKSIFIVFVHFLSFLFVFNNQSLLPVLLRTIPSLHTWRYPHIDIPT